MLLGERRLQEPYDANAATKTDSEEEEVTDSGSEYESSDDDTESVSADNTTDPLATACQKPFYALVLDAGPLFHNLAELGRLAEKFYAVPEVIKEIRSAAHRYQLAHNVYFQLELKEPSASDLAAVIEFAKKTGDYTSLSRPDLKVLALTYALERELNGTQSLGIATPATAPTSPDVSYETQAKPLVDAMASLDVASETDPSEQADAAQGGTFVDTDIQVIDDQGEGGDAQSGDDDDDGWITPANVEHVNARLGNGMVAPNESQQQIKVACATFDFAMQNVILQSGMSLAAVDGRQITSVKTWVQRCHACYTIIKRQSKRFCPECGNSTLTRVAASIDEQGNTRVHLKSGFQFNTRGTIFPIPRPKGGKKHTEMVFRQDQKEYMRAMHIKEKGAVKVTNIFDPDYIPNILLGHSGRGRQHNMSDVVAIRQKSRRATGNRKKRS